MTISNDLKNGDTRKAANRREYLLMRLRYTEGRLINAGGNDPILLQGVDNAWLVFAGKLDVFSVKVFEGRQASARHPLFRVDTGMVVFGMDMQGQTRGLLAVSSPDTQLIQITVAGLQALSADAEFTDAISEMLDDWIKVLSASTVEQLAPRQHTTLEPDREIVLGAGDSALSHHGVQWVSTLDGQLAYTGRDDVPVLQPPSVIPVTEQVWLQAVVESRLNAVPTREAFDRDLVWPNLNKFHRLALDCLRLNTRGVEQAERLQLTRRTEADQVRVAEGLLALASTLNPLPEAAFRITDQADLYLAACQMVGNALGIDVKPASTSVSGQAHQDPLRNIAQASRLRLRSVALRDDWWTHDNGPLLGFVQTVTPEHETPEHNTKVPVALLPTSPGSYQMYNPATQTRTTVTAKAADTLNAFAYTFYRPLPDQAVNAAQLIRFGLHDTRKDLQTILLMGIGAGLLSMALPIATGIIFDTVIPGGQGSQLLQLAAILLMSAFAAAAFQITQGIAMLRLEGKMESSVQAAVFDRLINLPATFFRNYSAGDLGVRALGVSGIRQTLSQIAISSALAFVMAIFNFVLLFFFSVPLALAALIMVLLAVAVTLTLGYAQVRQERKQLDLRGKLEGTVLQFINSIAKLRVAGAERRAFAVWARDFATLRQLSYKVRSLGNTLTVFSSVFPILTTMVIFSLVIAAQKDHALSIGGYLAFSAAFVQFLLAMLTLGTSFLTVLNVVPTYERARPIFQAMPEVDDRKADPGELDGAIEVSRVSFSYGPDTPQILNDVSFTIRPGEFVALVGPSGSGKSTLLRLLLGFERPNSGSVLYSGQDAAELDIRAVRRQIGVVLQNGKLMSGDVLSNIIGSSTLTIDDAWEAARMAGLEADIKEMPMGMHTLVSEGGGTLSGGQRQRLLIARAIVSRPRLIFFDEATSALDNRTQEIVSKSLENLSATRVVIAHRLTTIMNADRILVLESGRLVQSGTYDDLLTQEGLFADLAKRQLA